MIGGGSRSRYWGRIIAAALDRPLVYHRGGEVGPALGAARLARVATGAASVAEACARPAIDQVLEPEPAVQAALTPKRALFRRLYGDLAATFAASSPQEIAR